MQLECLAILCSLSAMTLWLSWPCFGPQGQFSGCALRPTPGTQALVMWAGYVTGVAGGLWWTGVLLQLPGGGR